MGKTIFISSHILSELAELCDSVTIIDRGVVKYSGSMEDLGVEADGKPAFTLTVPARVDGLDERLRGLAGVLNVTLHDERPAYHITVDPAVTDGNGLLRGILDLDVRVVGFAEHRKHLGQAFMDLTEQGVR